MKKNIAIVVSSPMMVNFFLIDQINHLINHFEVTLITGVSDKQVLLKKESISKNVKIITINMERKISVLSDFFTFFSLIGIFYRHKFDIVHSVSPKSGLLAQLAAFILGNKIRVHTFTGQVWVKKTGIWLYLLKSIDSLIVKVSTNILVDSYSQRSFLMAENILNHDNSRVLLNGSISGIDDKKFISSSKLYKAFRQEHGFPQDAKIILFIGRLAEDKGVTNLINTFIKILERDINCYLLLVGPDEDNIIEKYHNDENFKSNIMYFNYTDKPEYYMQVSDLLCLPSLREGFGNVVLEAALCKVPSVVSDIYGLKDVVEKDSTALIFSTEKSNNLFKSLLKMISDDKRRHEMGENAHKRAQYLFSKNSVNNELVDFYQELLDHNTKV